MTSLLAPYTGAALLVALTLAAALLGPAWRRLAATLAALAAIDVARATVAPWSQARALPWWCVDVALFAAWPLVMAWGLVVPKHEVPRRAHYAWERRRQIAEDGPVERATEAARVERFRGLSLDEDGAAFDGYEQVESEGARLGAHARMVPRLLGQVLTPHGAALIYVVALGAARPWLPGWAHLAGQVAPRLVLAGAWAAAVWMLWKSEGPTPKDEPRARLGVPGPGPLAAEAAGVFGRQVRAARGSTATTPASLPQLAALLLAGADFAAAMVAWSPVLRGLPPDWTVAHGLTLAGYGACAAVMGWAAVRGRG